MLIRVLSSYVGYIHLLYCQKRKFYIKSNAFRVSFGQRDEYMVRAIHAEVQKGEGGGGEIPDELGINQRMHD
jgi:hypothetical protein